MITMTVPYGSYEIGQWIDRDDFPLIQATEEFRILLQRHGTHVPASLAAPEWFAVDSPVVVTIDLTDDEAVLYRALLVDVGRYR